MAFHKAIRYLSKKEPLFRINVTDTNKEIGQIVDEFSAGPWLKVPEVELRGCMNEKEAKNLGINDVEFQHGKRNRDFCLAPLNRVEMLEGHKCLHNCKYCFLRSY